MTTHQIFAENIKSDGCVNCIKAALLKMKGVTAVEIHLQDNQIAVSGIAIERSEIIEKLAALGYPEKGHNNLLSKAKSYLSCVSGNHENSN